MKPVCQGCGIEIPLPKYNKKDSYKDYLQRKFCGRKCANSAFRHQARSRRTLSNIKECKHCGETIQRTKKNASQFDRVQFCGLACFHAHAKKYNLYKNQGGAQRIVKNGACIMCGKALRKGKLYCGNGCSNSAKRKAAASKVCNFCGKRYYHKSRQLTAFIKSKYCSRSCSGMDGKYLVGYTGNGQGRKRLLHRISAERLLQRKLKPDEVVHHINMDRTDNRSSNLLVTTNQKHMWLHQEMQRRYIREREGVLPDDLLSIGVWLGSFGSVRESSGNS